MPQFQIDLQEAFLDDLVVVLVNGEEVCRGSFRTRFQIGLAHTVQCEVPVGKAKYSIELPDKLLAVAGDVNISGDVFLGVTLTEDGQLLARISNEPFRYA